jgi:hypothetical protein
MRGETPKPITYSAATIVDEAGTPRYHILPSRLIVIGILSMGLLLMIGLILATLVLENKYNIDKLRDRINVEDRSTNAK